MQTKRSYLEAPSGRRYFLLDDKVNKIGKKGCPILLDDKTLPDHSASLIPLTGGGFQVMDMSGRLLLNGKKIIKNENLKNNDSISIGSIKFVYRGVSPQKNITAANPVQGTLIQTPGPKPLVTQTARQTPLLGGRPPMLTGRVLHVDGPHRVEKEGSLIGKLIGASILGLLTRGYLTGLPFWQRNELMVWYLRIQEDYSHNIFGVVLASKTPSTNILLSDIVSIWGKPVEGSILIQSAYNHGTNSWIHTRI